MVFISSRNNSSQTVLTDGLINIGNTYRKWCRPTRQGQPTFVNNGNGITLNGAGYYDVTATFVASGTEAGDITVSALENGIENGQFSTQSVPIADTRLTTLVLKFTVLVQTTKILNCETVVPVTVSFENSGVGATYTLANVDIEYRDLSRGLIG